MIGLRPQIRKLNPISASETFAQLTCQIVENGVLPYYRESLRVTCVTCITTGQRRFRQRRLDFSDSLGDSRYEGPGQRDGPGNIIENNNQGWQEIISRQFSSYSNHYRNTLSLPQETVRSHSSGKKTGRQLRPRYKHPHDVILRLRYRQGHEAIVGEPFMGLTSQYTNIDQNEQRKQCQTCAINKNLRTEEKEIKRRDKNRYDDDIGCIGCARIHVRLRVNNDDTDIELARIIDALDHYISFIVPMKSTSESSGNRISQRSDYSSTKRIAQMTTFRLCSPANGEVRDQHGHRHRLSGAGLLDAVAQNLHVLVLLTRNVLSVQGAVFESRGTVVRSGYVQGSVPWVERVRSGEVEGVPGQSAAGMAERISENRINRIQRSMYNTFHERHGPRSFHGAEQPVASSIAALCHPLPSTNRCKISITNLRTLIRENKDSFVENRTKSKVYSLVHQEELVAFVVQAPTLAGQFIPGDHDRLSDSALEPALLKYAFAYVQGKYLVSRVIRYPDNYYSICERSTFHSLQTTADKNDNTRRKECTLLNAEKQSRNSTTKLVQGSQISEQTEYGKKMWNFNDVELRYVSQERGCDMIETWCRMSRRSWYYKNTNQSHQSITVEIGCTLRIECALIRDISRYVSSVELWWLIFEASDLCSMYSTETCWHICSSVLQCTMQLLMCSKAEQNTERLKRSSFEKLNPPGVAGPGTYFNYFAIRKPHRKIVIPTIEYTLSKVSVRVSACEIYRQMAKIIKYFNIASNIVEISRRVLRDCHLENIHVDEETHRPIGRCLRNYYTFGYNDED
ncbi:hypothetical protein WN51_07505 [Melipona quadrifasciata]|uniref:Uncharacterized protein n=1 Tax=Melipona quadrifasciata TaxID=166423 RepID=A0A0N0U6R6_9HYME|nr:hypothetical protein WN51_07505 [Melipona quadrifasciata]